VAILWESAFRVGEVMNFSWDDITCIHPKWPASAREYPTLAIPSSQKNKKVQQIPMLPGLQALLERTPPPNRQGWVVNPLPVDTQPRTSSDWYKPSTDDLRKLTGDFSNSAIARACGVTETSVRKWLRQANIERGPTTRPATGDIPAHIGAGVRARAENIVAMQPADKNHRLSTEYVSRVVSDFGKKAGIVVRQPDKAAGRRTKYASAHDLRRSCAQRMINAGVSAESLRVVMRHDDFKTTERFYSAIREAQSAAEELHRVLAGTGGSDKKIELVGGLVGGTNPAPPLNPDQLRKLKALLDST
jgi:integrase